MSEYAVDPNPGEGELGTLKRILAESALIGSAAALSPIQPAAANEALLWQFLQNQPTISYDGSVNPPVTSINPTLFATWAQLVTDDYNPAGSTINLALLHCALDQPSMDGAVNALATLGVTGGTITLTGANPTGYAAHEDQVYTLDFNAVDIATIQATAPATFNLTIAGNLTTFTIDGSVSYTNGTSLGIAGLTTAAQLAAAAQGGGFGILAYGTVTNNGDGTVTISDSTEGNYPYTAPDMGTSGVVYTLVQAGVAAVIPANITTIENNGNELSINP